MLLTDARRPARTGPDGELIPLARAGPPPLGSAAIAEGVALVTAALSRGSVGAYQLQAAIAAVHDEVAARRGHRLAADPRALRPARADVGQPDGHAEPRDCASRWCTDRRLGFDAADGARYRPAARRHHRLDAVRAHLLEMAGDRDGAIAHYLEAAARTASVPERNYLNTQAARLASTPKSASSQRPTEPSEQRGERPPDQLVGGLQPILRSISFGVGACDLGN